VLRIGIDIGGSSVKAAALRGEAVEWTARSGTYSRPDRAALDRAIAEALARLAGRPDAVGVCVPGLLDESRTRVAHSVNVPGLSGVPLADLLARVGAARAPTVSSDANAAACDIYQGRRLTGRLLALVIGTGVGASVIDEAGLLRVDDDSPGHLGQCDVSLEGEPVIGPDGGAGSLEGYLGVPALAARYGSVENAFREMKAGDPPMRALARVIRIVHAIYRPHHVCLAGGIGIRLAPLLPALRDATNERVTRIARHDWTLTAGDNDFHAAVGAARLAMG
jgi:glucokinase